MSFSDNSERVDLVRALELALPSSKSLKNAPDFIIESYPRTGNTFLAAAVRTAWPHLTVKSHKHNPNHVHTADGSVPVVTLARKPLEAIASTAVLLSTFPERLEEAEDLTLLIGRYGNMLRAAEVNPHVLIVPFPALVENVGAVLAVLEQKYRLGPQATPASSSKLLELTHRISYAASTSQDEFLKRGNVPREKSPAYYEVLDKLSSPEYADSVADHTVLYEKVVARYYRDHAQ